MAQRIRNGSSSDTSNATRISCNEPERIGRRAFLQTAAVTLAVPSVIPAAALGSQGRPGANDRINVGLIGAGFRARDLILECPPDLNLVAVADCDLNQIDPFLAAVGKAGNQVVAEKIARYQDYRKMLSDEKLDAVFVATPTHARTLICLHAMQAGMDVYAEKPLTLTIEEGQYLVRAERKLGRICQVGTQQRSVPINNFGSDLVRNGAIGKVSTVLCPNFPGPRPRPQLPSSPEPQGMNWDLWCNQTEPTPFSTELHPGLGKWARYREYCGWYVTGWVHAFDQIQRALGTDHTGPVEIWPEETIPDGRVTLRYASGTLLKLDLPEDKGPKMGGIFIGEKGKIEINRNRLASNPPSLIQAAPPAADKNEYASVSNDHIRDWVSCMRTRKTTAAPMSIGHRSTTVCHLINICRELGRKLQWDPEHEKFIGDDEAEKLKSRPRRKGFELPEIS
jgi:hypothetical protein